MNKWVVFCSQLSEEDELDWMNKITLLMNGVSIISFRKLTTKQKKEVKVAIVANPKIEDLLELVNIQWLQSLWAGIDRLLLALAQSNIKIVRMVDPMLSTRMAESVLAWTYYLHRDMPKYLILQRNKKWEQQLFVEQCDRKIGILGLGVLGKAAAKRLQDNGFNVSGWSKHPKFLKGIDCYSGSKGLLHLLKKSNIIICLLPLTDQTNNLLNKKTLRALPKSASIINFSRGEILNEKDLFDCLKDKRIKHAVLDVFNHEPLPQEHIFWTSNNITILPHISAPTNKNTASKQVAKNILNFFATGKIPMSVDRKKGY
jgi:glyoxylate/hydroxypyruvate reductase A